MRSRLMMLAACAAILLWLSPFTSARTTETVCDAPIAVAHGDILTLPTAPVVLVPAHGADTLIVPSRAVLLHDWTANYTNIAATAAISIAHNNGYSMLTPAFEADYQISTLFANDEDTLLVFGPLANILRGTTPYAQYFWPAGVIDKPLTLGLYNGLLGNLTGGHADNALRGSVEYRVLDLATGAYLPCQ